MSELLYCHYRDKKESTMAFFLVEAMVHTSVLLVLDAIFFSLEWLISYGGFPRANFLNRALWAAPNGGVGTQCTFLVFSCHVYLCHLLTLDGPFIGL